MIKKYNDYEKIIEDLQVKYDECSNTLNAIRTGDVDAIVVQNGKENKVYALKDAQYSYRVMLEKMNEGAATISTDGLIFYSNKQLSCLLGVSLEELIGSHIDNFVKKSDYSRFKFFLENLKNQEGKIEVELILRDHGEEENIYVPVLISGNIQIQDSIKSFILIITDLREYKQQEKILKNEQFS
jgi:two-component system, OmpR family, phosphate regulon sensor histidine kinase PhoR